MAGNSNKRKRSSDKENNLNATNLPQSSESAKKQQKTASDFYGRILQETKSGRRPSRKSTPKEFILDPIKSERTGGFNLQFLFTTGEVVPVSVGDDELGLQQKFRQIPGYLTPTKMTASLSETSSPILETVTPQHRQFKKVAVVTAKRKRNLMASFEFYQEPGNAEKTEQQRPPVIHKTPEQVARDVLPPESETKVIEETLVTVEDIHNTQKKIRKSAKQHFQNTSANEMKNAVVGNDGRRYALSHLHAVGQGGRDVTEAITITTEGHNIKRMAVVEGPATQFLLDKENKNPRLYYSAESTLLSMDGQPTHVGVDETSQWRSPGKTSSVSVRLNAQNSERPSKTLNKMAYSFFSTTFSKNANKEEKEALSEPMTNLLKIR